MAMKKYYVKSGSNESLRLAHTPIQAAFLATENWLRQGVEEINGSIIVSEKGFRDMEQEGDWNFHIYDIIMMIRKNNKHLRNK